MSFTMSRKQYADMFGPTTGDAVRLADTDLFIEIEKDYTRYGDEAKFGGGKSIRDGMGLHPLITREEGAMELSLPMPLSLIIPAFIRRISAFATAGLPGSARAAIRSLWTESISLSGLPPRFSLRRG